MNKMFSLSKIMFVGLAIYLCIGIAQNILLVISFALPPFSWQSLGIFIFSLCLSLAFLTAVIKMLVFKRDKWARKLIAKDIAPDQPLNTELTLFMAFRLVCVGVGLYCLRSFFWSISQLLRNLSMNIKYNLSSGEVRRFSTVGVDYILPILYLIFAVYLLCGAPHFVRWQVKKTLELCNEPGDDIKKPVE
jgi:membrane protease YdiL (CAAX protease family)